jgi:hypothetical protein
MGSRCTGAFVFESRGMPGVEDSHVGKCGRAQIKNDGRLQNQTKGTGAFVSKVAGYRE